MFRVRILIAVVIPALVACDPGSFSTGPMEICEEAGAQCLLPKGPLGVCEQAPCESGGAPPCFRCTPQH